MNKTSISDLKAKAKDQLLGNYKIAAGSFALLFAFVYAVMIVITSAFAVGFSPDSRTVTAPGFGSYIEGQILGMVIAILTSLLSVGYIHLLMKIAHGEKPAVSEIFYVFRNHPDKIIIISVVMTGIQMILLLPSGLISYRGFSQEGELAFDGKRFFLWIVLYVAGLAISFFIDLMLAMSFMIYLDDPDANVADIMKESIIMMKGNKFRYFYMLLSFIGYWMLIILSFGIAMLWVVPYQTMTTVGFYEDLKGPVDYVEAEEL